MDNFSRDMISFLQYLLPGFLSAWVFYGFTSFRKPSQFERVVQALIFTLIIQSIVFIERSIALKLCDFFCLGNWTERLEVLFSSVTAFFLGVLFSYFSNNDKFHRFARKLGITRDTSYPSEWFGVFTKNITFIVLHFKKDGRRLYGWPMEWPSDPNSGHFMLAQAAWLDEDNNEIPITGVSSILVNVKDVKMVEFLEEKLEKNNE